ncbi:MAG: hypothetical protein VYA30_13125 [Myxococcota bacterium]|nr:hypothetical protein [Myxococcota bacterium]
MSQNSSGQSGNLVDAKRRLRDAKSTFDFGEYQTTIDKLTPAIEPEVLLADRQDLIDAYTLLGLSHYFLGKQGSAQAYFERLIEYHPDAALDPVKTPPPAVSFFQDIRERLAKEIAAKKELRRQQLALEEKRRREANTIRYRRDIQIRSRIAAFLPFGVGQFQNQEPVFGSILLGSQVAALSVSLASFLAVENLRGTDGRFRNADVNQARQLQTVQLYSGGLAIGLMVVGIAQALWVYEPTRFIKEQELPRKTPKLELSPNGFRLRF